MPEDTPAVTITPPTPYFQIVDIKWNNTHVSIKFADGVEASGPALWLRESIVPRPKIQGSTQIVGGGTTRE